MAAIFNLNHPARTVHWYFFDMSVANIVVIAAMLIAFALALALPFPGAPKAGRASVSASSAPGATTHRRSASWVYLLGVATIASLIVIVLSGVILCLKGPAWWHFTGVGHFFNSIHLWAVELFFFFMVIHLWAKFWMAAWRGGRTRVWITGAIGFLLAIPAALTGYLSQQNFDSQWLAIQAKDGLNSIGAGAFFNVTDFGQMYSYHVLLLPLAVALLVVAHVRLVCRHGMVPPFGIDSRLGAAEATAAASPSKLPPSPARGVRA